MLGIGVCSDPWTSPILVYVVVLSFCEGPSDGTSLGPPRLCLEGRKLMETVVKVVDLAHQLPHR